jgi:hypothetical protein
VKSRWVYTGNWEVSLDLYPAALFQVPFTITETFTSNWNHNEFLKSCSIFSWWIDFFIDIGVCCSHCYHLSLNDQKYLIWMGFKSQMVAVRIFSLLQKCRGICKFWHSVISLIYFRGFKESGGKLKSGFGALFVVVLNGCVFSMMN